MPEAKNQRPTLTTTRDDSSPAAGEVAKLREENERLRAELAEAKRNQKAKPNTRPQPEEPSYGLSEGQRDELEREGKTVSPFTGARQVGSGRGDVREVDQDEFVKAGK
ncbi:MAG: hypothetical protein JXA67_20325 [Micromonosporaceae bacterium]|nr:hypothetical protein [Micromonosporaceae bacterium]